MIERRGNVGVHARLRLMLTLDGRSNVGKGINQFNYTLARKTVTTYVTQKNGDSFREHKIILSYDL